MPDYKRMYAVLCSAVDSVIDPLEDIPAATPQAKILLNVLLEAEELFIDTSFSGTNNAEDGFCVVRFKEVI